MRIVVVYGQSHKGSTYHIARMLAEKLEGEITEFFLPKDFGDFCVGCTMCFMKDASMCPHYERLKPVTEAMKRADVLILASPVYVYHVTGPMKAWLDHYGYQWMVHRPEETMFTKQAVVISTAAGGGMRPTNKDMADSLFFWGIPKIYKYGLAVNATAYEQVSGKKRAAIERKTTILAERIKKRNGKVKPGLKTRLFFEVMSRVQRKGWLKTDSIYWQEKGWTGKQRPWRR